MSTKNPKSRKGSLGFRLVRSKQQIPSQNDINAAPCWYFRKAGMTTYVNSNKERVACTDLEMIPLTVGKQVKENRNLVTLQLSDLVSDRKRHDVQRELNNPNLNALLDKSHYDIIGITKGKGFQGPVKIRGLKVGKRKVKGTRSPGPMGTRQPGQVRWTKPFAGQLGYGRRTVYNIEKILYMDQCNITYPGYGEARCILRVKGSVPGPRGRICLVRQAVRK